MRLSGEATINAAVADIYTALHDPAVLVRTIPGCQRLEQVGDDAYKATVLAGVASIRGSFDGDVRLTDADPPHAFTLRATGAGAPGTVSAVARVTLAPAEAGSTVLRYDADAIIGGVIAGVGQRVIAGVARRTAADFFAAIDRELTGVPAPVAPVPSGYPAAGLPGGGAARAGAAVGGAEVGGAAVGGAAVGGVAVGGVSGGAGGVWTAPARPGDPARQRVRDLLVGAAFGALVALLGVLVGAIVAGW